MRFDDILITADYDFTLTGPDATIPERNLEAIRYFTENGGTFTVNTGRSAVTAKTFMDQIPANAPFLLYNGSAAYCNGKITQLKCIDLPPWSILDRLAEEFPQLVLEVQGLHTHYGVNATYADRQYYAKMGWSLTEVVSGDDIGPFIKFNVQALRTTALSGVIRGGSEEDAALFDRVQQRIEELWGNKLTVFRAGDRLLNVHTKGVSKGNAALELKARLGKKILICIGDADNDLAMMDAADYAFCPADGVIADRYPTVCNCAEGAVADVIYKKIPEILANSP